MRLLFRRFSVLACLALSAATATTAAGPAQLRVRLETDAGNIVVALDARHAPQTTANFLQYVDDGRFDGTAFYRASRAKSDARRGFIQGGIDTDFRRTIMPAVVLESTDRTGIKHLDATITMARHAEPNSATGNFSITVGPAPAMDARPGNPGYAAFGRVVSGMDVVKKILARPTCCGKGVMFGQMLKPKVTIRRAVRLDGTARPSGAFKTWLMGSNKKK